MKQVVRNNQLQPVTLEDGTILAASGSDGSQKTVELSDGDRKRLVDAGLLIVMKDGPAALPVEVGKAAGKQEATQVVREALSQEKMK